jgi:hypothetical protein
MTTAVARTVEVPAYAANLIVAGVPYNCCLLQSLQKRLPEKGDAHYCASDVGWRAVVDGWWWKVVHITIATKLQPKIELAAVLRL